jgi:eukaryotic-like serine/threonine-protein kinase
MTVFSCDRAGGARQQRQGHCVQHRVEMRASGDRPAEPAASSERGDAVVSERADAVVCERRDGRAGGTSRGGAALGPRATAAGEPWLQVGAILDGKFRMVRQLARGSMGSVWCAEHLALQAPVAIKFMQPALNGDADVQRRFLREARIASAMRSPHVVQVLDYGVVRGTPYIVMEFLRGESLADRLQRQGHLSPRETIDILRPLAHALGRAHELGVVHRDLKPENLFIVQDGAREITKLIDFGVAKVRERQFGVTMARNTRDGEIVGTPHYMSPEQVRGVQTVDHRTDVWALGVIAFECLVGSSPFAAANLATLILQICAQPVPVPSALGVVPEGFDAWFARACARAPDRRFPTVKVAIDELQGVCAERERQTLEPPCWAITHPGRGRELGAALDRLRRFRAPALLAALAAAAWLVTALVRPVTPAPGRERDLSSAAASERRDAFARRYRGLGRHAGDARAMRVGEGAARPDREPSR